MPDEKASQAPAKATDDDTGDGAKVDKTLRSPRPEGLGVDADDDDQGGGGGPHGKGTGTLTSKRPPGL